MLSFLAFSIKAQTGTNFYTQGNNNRLAAEWEPALGTLIAWPLALPYKLVVELAKDNHLYVLVENDSTKKDAIKWFTIWGIDPATLTFMYAPQGVDIWWVRDWGPAAIFTPAHKMKLADPKYTYSTPVTNTGCNDSLFFLYKTKDNKIIKTDTDDSVTLFMGKELNTEVLDMPYVSTGGNMLSDGIGAAFSTCILLNENKFYGVEENKFFQLNKDLAGIQSYHIISNFEKRGIQHIDCFMKLLDEERILVMEPPADHSLYPVYDSIVKYELSKLKTYYGRPYEILRLKTDRDKRQELAAYSNSIIINKTIYVPLFHIKQDSIALERWREVMPGYTVKGFEYELADEPFVDKKTKDHYVAHGWNNGDALHCRTRAIWDPEMLFITTKRIEKEVDSKNDNTVYTTIIDYSDKGFVSESAKLFWRVAGENNWKYILLKQMKNTDNFSASIPFHKQGTTIEYYISAASKSGRKETQPKTAPLGTYKFTIK